MRAKHRRLHKSLKLCMSTQSGKSQRVGKAGKKTLVLIDGNALVHRSFHAIPPLTTKKGEQVNAVYGFTSTLLSVLEKFKPEYIAATFDVSGPTFRHKAYAEYKATRAKAPQELYDQIPIVKEVVRAFNIPIYEQAGFEADDAIGTLSLMADTHEDLETIIVTGDADTLQLVSGGTKVFTMRRGITDTVLYDEAKVYDKYGLAPYQLADFKGLRGDPSDNIPGVKGVGEKTASDLLQKYETLEGVYKHLDEIKPAVCAKLKRDKQQAFLSRELGTIKRDAPFELDLPKCKTTDFNRANVVDLLRRLDFFSLIKRVNRDDEDNQKKQLGVSIESDTSLKSLKSNTSKKVQIRNNDGVSDAKHEVLKLENILRFKKEVYDAGSFAFDLFWEGENARHATLVGVAISYKTGRVWLLRYENEYKPLIKELFTSTQLTKIGYDVKSAFHVFWGVDVELSIPFRDVLIDAYILNSGSDLSLEKLALQEIGEEIGDNQVISNQQMLTITPLEDRMVNTAVRVGMIFKLARVYTTRISEESKGRRQDLAAHSNHVQHSLEAVVKNIELPLVPILARMEQNGIAVDTVVLKGISENLGERIKKLEKDTFALSGKNFNLNSPKQLSEILFTDLRIPTIGIKKTKTGFSTASSELEKLSEYPIIAKIEEYREYFKLKSTYLDTFPKMVECDGRIHSTFHQTVTTTGRLSSTNPNLQNIPIRTDIGRLIRTAFTAPKGKCLVSADYSQIDLRCVAHVSGDKKLIEAFHRGDDIHAITASEINQVPLSRVTKTMRHNAKELNFGVLYGMGTYGFSRTSGVDQKTARAFIDAYMKKFSGVARYLKETKESARKLGYVETLFGRRRYVPEITSANHQVVSAAERMAVNMPIQGLTADIMKLAMIATDGVVREYGREAMTLLQIHDELIFEIPESFAQEFADRIQKVMERVRALDVPLKVDISSGYSWAEL